MPFKTYVNIDIYPVDQKGQFRRPTPTRREVNQMPFQYPIDIEEHWDQFETSANELLYFNSLLDQKSQFFSLNEADLENLIDQLGGKPFIKEEIYWLTMARVNELALLCAGNYANNAEFSLMGDLLLNPRLILIHIRGQNRPVVKKRHTLLTDQFRHMAESKTDIVQWLKKETIVEIKMKALLPHLFQELENSGFIHQKYLESVKTRTQQIAEWVGFLHSGGLINSVSIYNWLSNASPSDRKMFDSKRIRLDLEPFWELGRQIKVLARIPVTKQALFTQHPITEHIGA
jgi:hypothetical protein